MTRRADIAEVARHARVSKSTVSRVINGGYASPEVRTRVSAAREVQRARFAALGAKGIRTNAECSGTLLEQVAMPDEAGITLLRQASEVLKLSARGFHRTLRVARTRADLDGAQNVARVHVAEALGYRGETLRQQRAA